MEKKIRITFDSVEKAVPDVIVEDTDSECVEEAKEMAGNAGRPGVHGGELGKTIAGQDAANSGSGADAPDEEDEGTEMHVQYDTLAVPEINID